MKISKFFALLLLPVLLLTACAGPEDAATDPTATSTPPTEAQAGTESFDHAVSLELSDTQILVDGDLISTDPAAAVYAAHDIIYYEEGQDFTYGEGTDADAHSAQEAAEHTVVHIAQAGTYVLTGSLSKGQIAVDLGEGAEEDPTAVVTLILNGVDITCTVGPSVIFYQVYECGSADADTATVDVDTAAAGANVILADGSRNLIRGSYVARIYKPDTVELDETGTAVLDAKKLHKYDGAFYSKMSMNLSGGQAGTGCLYIDAENEGLDSELHLTVHSGNIYIESGNDGINTNEDCVSVTRIRGGLLDITVTGETGEGDGIDSNGWIVIEGGTVITQACSTSGDAGIDSDMGIYVEGGTLISSGYMLDRIEAGGQNYAVFNFAQTLSGGQKIELKDAAGSVVFACTPQNSFSSLILSSPQFSAGDYTLYVDGVQYQGSPEAGGMGGGMMRPEGDVPEGFDPSGVTPPTGEAPEGFDPRAMTPPTGEAPEDFDPGAMTPPTGENAQDPGSMFRPGGMGGPGKDTGAKAPTDLSVIFTIPDGGVLFRNVTAA